jgi:hypothetical protein
MGRDRTRGRERVGDREGAEKANRQREGRMKRNRERKKGEVRGKKGKRQSAGEGSQPAVGSKPRSAPLRRHPQAAGPLLPLRGSPTPGSRQARLPGTAEGPRTAKSSSAAPAAGSRGAAPSGSERAPRLRCRSERPRREQGSETEGAGEGGSACGGARRLRAARERRAQPPTLPGQPGPRGGGGGGASRCWAHTDAVPLPARPGTRAGGRPGHGARPFAKNWERGCIRKREAARTSPAAGQGASAPQAGNQDPTAETRLSVPGPALGTRVAARRHHGSLYTAR